MISLARAARRVSMAGLLAGAFAGAAQAEPLVLYHENEAGAGGVVMVRDAVRNSVAPDRDIDWRHCLVVDAARIASLRGGDAAGVLALVDDTLADYGSDLTYGRTDSQTDRAQAGTLAAYEQAHQARIDRGIIAAYEIQYSFVRDVTPRAYRDALARRLAAGMDPAQLWTPGGHYPDIGSYLDGVLDQRVHMLMLLESAAGRAQRGERQFKNYAVLHDAHGAIIDEIAGTARWKNNPFHVLGLAQQHPALVARAQAFLRDYEGLVAVDYNLYALRALADSRAAGGPHTTTDGCSVTYDVRVPGAYKRLPYAFD